jgi:glycosyltransferase involved in cell wall biosynthesis
MPAVRKVKTAEVGTLAGARVLLVATVDSTVSAFLLPLIDAVRREGAMAEAAAACGADARELAARGYVIHPISFSRRLLSLSHARSLWQLVRLLRKGDYDLVHVHTPVAGVVGRIAARIARVRVVIHTAHGFYFHDRMHPLPRWVLVLVEKTLGRACTDFLFTVSPEDYRTALRSRIARPEKLGCLNSVGVDLAAFDRESATPVDPASLGLRSGVPVVAFVGRLVKEKGALDLLRAMRRLKEDDVPTQLLIIGSALPMDRARGFEREACKLISAGALDNRVHFVGFRSDVPAILRWVDVLVLPSYREGMPVTILEAMAASKPVVATNVRGCREEVVDGVSGWIVPPADPAALADAIRRVLCDPERARAMGRAGRARAEAEYDQTRVIAEQLAVYRELLREHPRHSHAEEAE